MSLVFAAEQCFTGPSSIIDSCYLTSRLVLLRRSKYELQVKHGLYEEDLRNRVQKRMGMKAVRVLNMRSAASSHSHHKVSKATR